MLLHLLTYSFSSNIDFRFLSLFFFLGRLSDTMHLKEFQRDDKLHLSVLDMKDAKLESESSFLVHRHLLRWKLAKCQPASHHPFLKSSLFEWIRASKIFLTPIIFWAYSMTSPTWSLRFPYSGSRSYSRNLCGSRTCCFMRVLLHPAVLKMDSECALLFRLSLEELFTTSSDVCHL